MRLFPLLLAITAHCHGRPSPTSTALTSPAVTKPVVCTSSATATWFATAGCEISCPSTAVCIYDCRYHYAKARLRRSILIPENSGSDRALRLRPRERGRHNDHALSHQVALFPVLFRVGNRYPKAAVSD